MRGIFFYTIGIAFASGIFTRSFFDLGIEEIVFLLLISFALAIVWRRKTRSFLSPLFLTSLALLCFSLGILRLEATDRTSSTLSQFVGENVVLEGVIVREPDERSSTVHLYVRVDEINELVLITTDRFQSFTYGDRVRAEGELSQPQSFETDLGKTFNYPGYLKARGVSQMISFAKVRVVGKGEGNVVLKALLGGKSVFMRTVERIIPEPEAGLGEGVLLGVKRALGEELEDVFRRTGIIHIVVLSGYNVMLVAEAIGRLLSLVLASRLRMLVGIFGIASFALLVGLSATVIRASIMAILILIARATGRRYAIMRALMLAGIIMLLVNPYLLTFDPGFQLSFMATLGLIFLAPLLEEKLKLVPTTLQIREFLTATIATQIFVLPLLLYLMGTFSLVSVAVNVLVLPMVPVAMLLTFFAGISGLILSPLGTVIGYSAFLSLAYIIGIANFFSKFSFASFLIPTFPFWAVVLSYIFLGCGLYFLLSREDKLKTDATVQVIDDLDDWTIEEETEVDPDLHSKFSDKPKEDIDMFPFR